jgi:hypothetical protein
VPSGKFTLLVEMFFRMATCGCARRRVSRMAASRAGVCPFQSSIDTEARREISCRESDVLCDDASSDSSDVILERQEG